MFLPLHIDLPPPATRERPPGCKTVFVGGLPENGTEQIIVEVFEQCGEIIAIRKSKKNFCHIRFAEEYMVDKALYLSGRCLDGGSEYLQLQQLKSELNIAPSCLQRWKMPVSTHLLPFKNLQYLPIVYEITPDSLRVASTGLSCLLSFSASSPSSAVWNYIPTTLNRIFSSQNVLRHLILFF